MSAEGIKKNYGTVLFIVVLLAGLGYIGWKLKGALAGQQEVVSELEAQERELSTLERHRPFPSNDNVETLRTNRELMEMLYERLRTAATHPVEVPEVDQVKFATMLGQRLSQLNRQARRAKIDLPPNFAFGFQEYIGVLPPDDSELINTITKQLLVISRICQLLYETDTMSIAEVTREEVAPTPPAMDGFQSAEQSTEQLFSSMSFDLKFTTTTAGLQKFLNALTQEEWMFVVSRIDLGVKTEQYQVPLEAPPPVKVPDRTAPRSPMDPRLMMDPRMGMGGPGANPSAPAGMRTVERDDLVVNIRIDLVEFPQSAEETSEAETDE